jgi:thioredoxin-related protein
MKIIFSIFLAYSLSLAASNKIDVPYKEALAKNAKDGKPILLEFHAKWCIPCLEMEKTVFKNSAIIKELRASFHFVRIDADSEQELFCEGENLLVLDCMLLWEVEGIPAFAILDKEGKLSHIANGQFDAPEFLNFLKAVKMSLKKEKGLSQYSGYA